MSRVQNTNDGFELRESPEKGEGIFATEPFGQDIHLTMCGKKDLRD